jgi:hypothetical protein
MSRRLTALLALLLTLMSFLTAFAGDGGIDFFEKKIRPVLVEQCYTCHSVQAKKQKGGLYLDSKEGLVKGGESGPAFVAGKPDESLLIKAVRYEDPEIRMPPKGKLPAATIADLEKWVKLGAPDPRTDDGPRVVKEGSVLDRAKVFWAYQPPKKVAAPMVKSATWPTGAVDRFLLEKLEKHGLEPAPDADKVTLLRRAYLTLIGLPPTPQQIDAFVKDRSPGAFAAVVDGLLASPRFGERWGRHWLDVARFAESSGGGRSLLFKEAWRYRDYVIAAFNADKPYDRFIVEQIAGDLLRSDNPDDRAMATIATAFLLLGPTNFESQDKPILEMDMIDEQLDTMGRAFLGMTIGCARCHDHKFDPIPQTDYYALAGIMRSTKMIIHENVSRWTETPLPVSGAEEALIRKHETAVVALKEKLRLAQAADIKAGKTAYAAGKLAVAELPGIVIDDTQAKKIGNWKHSTFSGNFIGEGYLYDDRAAKGEKTLTFIPDFPKRGNFEVRLAYVPHQNRATNVPVRIFHADGEATVPVNQRKAPTDGHFVSLGTYRFEKGSQYFVMVLTDGANGHVVADAVQFLPEDVAIKTEAKKPGAKSEFALDAKTLAAELKRLEAKAPYRPVAMAVSDLDKAADCHLCIRGNFHNRGAVVPRGFLQALIPPGADKAKLAVPAKESGRRQLARWLASPDNPLTARVMVNRIWHHLMGAGIVRTVDNFGYTGELPSHPELLDYLALRFVEQGWSIKKMIREIMLSHAFRMSSAAGDPAAFNLAQKVDPENRLVWHMNRRRHDAEVIRDTMLVLSGDLDLTVGGTLIKKDTLERSYQFEDKRRSVYTPVFRNRLLELMEAFDFADPNISLGKRTPSTVSTQALYMMNSPFVMDQATRAARKLLADPAMDDAGRADLAYRLALGRLPTARERQLALEYVQSAAPAERQAAWGRFYQTLFACVDFRYLN